VIPARVELNGLGDIAILLFDGLVVGGYVQSELAFFGVGLPELQTDRGNRLRLRPCEERELIVVAVAFVLEDLEIRASVGDEATLHSQVSDGALQLGFGSFQIGLRGCDVRLHAAHVGRHARDVAGNCLDRFLLLLL